MTTRSAPEAAPAPTAPSSSVDSVSDTAPNDSAPNDSAPEVVGTEPSTTTPATTASSGGVGGGPGIDPVPGEWRRVSPKYIAVDLLGTVVFGLIVIVGSALPWWFSQNPWLLLIPLGMLLMFGIPAALTPRRVRAIGYRLRDDDLLFRRGILTRRVVAVPYGRMQLVDITRGPLERRVGLSSLKLVTAAAASNIAIPGLPEAEADSLRDRLVELAETRRAGL